MNGRSEESVDRWLLLIHQIPPKPDYLRVKIGRRLQRVGAVPVKNSVYVLPEGEQSFEDFQWIRTEIVDGGGDASVCRAEFVDGLTGDDIRQLFRNARAADYAEIAARARVLWSEARRGRAERPEDELTRLRNRFKTVAALDFFGAPERTIAQDALSRLETEVQPEVTATAHANRSVTASLEEYRGLTWVTRANVFVDRIASAWLIMRFVDPQARFRFVPESRYRPARGEVRFDMFDGEFTHEGDRCTFEVLVERLGIDDAAIRTLAEVVHNIDLKDGKFERDEAPGVEQVLKAIVSSHAEDAARLERGGQLFDELYALLGSEAVAGVSRTRAT